MNRVVSRSPQRPDDVVVDVAVTDPAAVHNAADTARQAARDWSAATALARARALHQLADAIGADRETLSALIVREVGKPVSEAGAEVDRGIALVRYYAQQTLDPVGETYPAPDGTSLLYTFRRPHGVVGLITPWNFPIAIPLWKMAPALAYGNTVVWKPAPEATGVALRLHELCAAALPSGVVTIVLGDAETGRAVVDTTDAVSFTGSAHVGALVRIAAAERGIPSQCEMGSVNASIVFPDYPVEDAARVIASAAMGYAGQKCTATSRVIVVGDPEPLVDALVAAVEAFPVGDPADPTTGMGPVISADSLEAVLTAADEARASGGALLTGGRRCRDDGWYAAPTLVRGLAPGHRLAQEEIFGPFCVLLTARDTDEAFELANAVRYGLVAAVFTHDTRVVAEAVRRLDTGLIRINAATTGVDFYAPFGGQKLSSSGPREQGKAARDFFTTVHTVTITPA